MVLTCLVAASLWAVMRITENGRGWDYLLFGLIVGLGLISKWGFAGFLLLLFIAAMLQPSLRSRILTPSFLFSLGAVAVVSAPVVYWLIVGQHDLVALYGKAVAPKAHHDRLHATLIGTWPLDLCAARLPVSARRDLAGAVSRQRAKGVG